SDYQISQDTISLLLWREHLINAKPLHRHLRLFKSLEKSVKLTQFLTHLFL
ncbi:MAG: hypothetical protein ACI9MF_001712, partial [Gammaproteobacteria bacterium]